MPSQPLLPASLPLPCVAPLCCLGSVFTRRGGPSLVAPRPREREEKGKKREKGKKVRGCWLLSSPARTGAGRDEALTKGNRKKERKGSCVVCLAICGQRRRKTATTTEKRGGKVKDGTAPRQPLHRSRTKKTSASECPETSDTPERRC
jgi:hypothetical protein